MDGCLPRFGDKVQVQLQALSCEWLADNEVPGDYTLFSSLNKLTALELADISPDNIGLLVNLRCAFACLPCCFEATGICICCSDLRPLCTLLDPAISLLERQPLIATAEKHECKLTPD